MLNLLVLLNKYEVQKYEEYLIAVIKPLTSREALKTHLKEDLSASDVLRIARRVQQPSIAESARNVILDQLWGKEALTSPYESLLFGEELNDKVIIGASYYQILLRGEDKWVDINLTDIHRRNLTAGRLRCGEEWQKIFDSIAGAGDHPIVNSAYWQDSYDSRPNTRLLDLWRRLGRSHLPWYDLIGKIEIMTSITRGLGDFRSAIGERNEVHKLKAALHLYFQAENI